MASEGYRKACALGTHEADCRKARDKEVAIFERYRAGCQRGVSDDCNALGNLVHRIDPPRAVRLFLAEAELRGVADLAGGPAAFVRERIGEAEGAGVIDPTAPREPAPTGDEPSLHLGPPEVLGRLSKVHVDRLIQRRAGAIAACRRHAESPSATGRMVVELIVDRTGDVWKARAVESTLPPAIAACIARVFSELVFTAPASGTPTIRYPVEFD